jgi:hypothetical protein
MDFFSNLGLNSKLKFKNYFIFSSARLGPKDADIVDVIHTDGNARYLDYIPQVSIN